MAYRPLRKGAYVVMESSARQHMLSRLKRAGGGWVSGGDLSRELRISRTAVWKHVCSLRSEGYVIESSTRKGYLLRESLDRLVPSEIEASLRTARLGRRVVCEREVDSTNRLARDLAIAGAAEGTLVHGTTRGDGTTGDLYREAVRILQLDHPIDAAPHVVTTTPATVAVQAPST